jgi:hypothetical protein
MQTQTKNRLFVTLALFMVFCPIIWMSVTLVTLSRKGEAWDVQCSQNMKEIRRGVEAYAKQHNGELPNAARWVDELQPYLPNATVLHCPADHSTARSSYAMNPALSGKRLADLSGSRIVLVFETKQTGANPAGTAKDVVDIGRDSTGRHFHIATRYNYYLTTDLIIHRIGMKPQIEQLHWNTGH